MADLQGVPQESALEVDGPTCRIPHSGEPILELSYSFLLHLVLGVGHTLSSPVSVTTDGADNITVRQIMMISVDLLLRREWAEEQAGTLTN